MRNRNWGEIAGRSSFLLPFPFKRVWTLSKALGYAIQVQVTSIFGRLKARACTESKINLNPSWAYHKNYGERRSPRHTPMVSKIFGNTQCLSHSSSHGFLFFANPVKRSLRSLSHSSFSPTPPLPDGCPAWQLSRLGRNSSPSIVFGLSPSSERCCCRRLRSGEARGLVLLLL